MSDKIRRCLGLDTSNYTTSAAVVDEKLNIVCEFREVLKVKQGERGLRQSQALFEHIGNLPEVIRGMDFDSGGLIAAVAVSERPRRIEGSYMPVFKAGEAVGKSFSCLTGAKYFGFSHQEGHIAAALYSTELEKRAEAGEEFLSLHLSGGTTEMLMCRRDMRTGGYETQIVGCTKDISLGQLIDRIGVSMGLEFPCGAAMDRHALESRESDAEFCRIKVRGGELNISGIETQIQRYIKNTAVGGVVSDDMKLSISSALFRRVGQAIADMIEQGRQKTGIKPVIVAGGVASSSFIRKMLSSEPDLFFGSPGLSSDNAVGTAILGMKRYLENETDKSFTD